MRFLSIVPFAILALSIDARAARNPGTECGVAQKRPAQRVFVDLGDKHGWREYRSLKDLPELQPDASILAQLWTVSNHERFIRIETQGQDFAIYTGYCFDGAGRLVQINFEVRTAWGWGFRQEGSIENGRLSSHFSEYFATATAARISKPEQANDVADVLSPHLYLRESQLPFAEFLMK